MIYRLILILIIASNFGSFYSQQYSSAIGYFNKEKYEKAIPELKKSILFYEDSLGENDSSILPDLRFYLGVSYYFNGQLVESIEAYEDNVKKCKICFQNFSEPGLKSLQDLCAVYGELGETESVIRCRREIIDGWRTIENDESDYEIADALNELAVAESSIGKDSAAIVSYTESLRFLDKCNSVDPLYVESIRRNRASSYAYVEDYENAKKDYLTVFETTLKQYPIEYSKHINSFRKLATEMTSLGYYQNAIRALEIDIEAIKSLISEQDTALIESYIDLGSNYDYIDDRVSAGLCYDTAGILILENYSLGTFDRGFWDYVLASSYEFIFDHKKTLEYYLSSMEFYERNKEKYLAGYLVANDGILRNYLALERFEEGYPHSQIKVEYYGKDLQKKEYFGLYLKAVVEKSQIEQKLKNPVSAIETLESAKRKTLKFLGNGIEYQSLLDELISSYASMSNYKMAMSYSDEKIEIINESVGQNLDYYVAINNKGQLYYESGNYINALEYYEKANAFLCKQDYLNCANSLNNIAMTQTELGNYEIAEKTYLKILNIHEENDPNNEYYMVALCNVARLYLDMKKLEKCTESYEKAYRLAKDLLGKKSKIYLTAMQGLANCYIRTIGKAEEGVNLFVECIPLITELYGSHDSYAIQMFGNIGHVLCVAQRFDDGISILDKIYQRQLEDLGSKSLNTMLTLTNLSLAYLSNEQLDEARDLNEILLKNIDNDANSNLKLLSEGESILYLEKMRLYYSSPFSYLHRNYQNDSEIIESTLNSTINNKGRLLKSNSALKIQVQNSNDTELVSKYNSWIEMIENIIYLQANNGSEAEIDKLNNEANNLEKDLIKSSSIFAKSINSKLNWRDIQKRLNSDEYVLEFVNYNQSKMFVGDTVQYGVYLFDKTSKYPTFIPLFTKRELTNILGDFGGNNLNYINQLYGKGRETSKLYDLIWKNIAELVPEKSKVIISPSGLLHKISFAGLSDGSNFLNERYDLSYVSSLSTIGESVFENLATLDPLLVGGINYDMGVASTDDHIWSYLTGTKLEADEIAYLFKKAKIKSTSLTKDIVTEDRLFSEIKSKNIAHIATHGFFYPLVPEDMILSEDEAIIEDVGFRGGNKGSGYNFYVNNKNALMRSGLALSGANNIWNMDSLDLESDGILTAQDIVVKDFRNLDLVVLSACETGLGDIQGSEGVFGLQRSLKMSGVNHIIMSLWQVPDNETKEFMILFYSKLIATKSIDQSFKDAQKEMSRKYDPFYWAAFVLI